MKLLNEQYLQQRIEELEKKVNLELSPTSNSEYWDKIEELKLLLANCEEVELIDFNNIPYGSYLLPDELEEQGYKLIKVKQ